MFLLDSLMISGIRWTLETVVSAAQAELDDDTALRQQLLDAVQRRELGEISDERYREIEADLLARIREIKRRREGGEGPLAFGRPDTADGPDQSRIQVDASVVGDFHAPPPAGVPPAARPSAVAPESTPAPAVRDRRRQPRRAPLKARRAGAKSRSSTRSRS